MRDSRTLLLILVTICLVGTWVFYIYDKVRNSTVVPVLPAADTTTRKKELNDSLSRLYQASVRQIETAKSGQDSLNRELQQKMREMDTLRNEINQMLSINTLTREDLEKASKKIQQLQRQITSLTSPTSSAITDLPIPIEPKSKGTSTGGGTTAPVSKPAVVPVKTASSGALQAADIRFQAVERDAQAWEQSTSSVVLAELLHVAVTVKNNQLSFPGTQLYLVIKSPSGQLVLDDEWMSGVFTSAQEGNLRFSRRLSFDYSKGEVKRLTASVALNRSEPGTYQLYIYHNGQRIGKASIPLQ